MDEKEFRQTLIGWIANMTRALQKMSEQLEYIGSRLDEIRMELIKETVEEE